MKTMKTKIKNTVKGKIKKFSALPLNTKLLIAILAVAVFGLGLAVAMPSIQESRQEAKARAAAEALYGKDFDKIETYIQPQQQRKPRPGGLGTPYYRQ